MTTPLRRPHTCLAPSTSAKSAAVVPSSTRQTSGFSANAAQRAPRKPTSSCTPNTNHVSTAGCSRKIVSITAQPTRSSIAFALSNPSPKRTHAESNTPYVPSGTFFCASFLSDAPMSMYRLLVFGMVLRSSRVVRCTALMPTTPRTSPNKMRLPMTTRGSTPPTKPNFTQPSSVYPLQITPTSSI